jgi:hypothetical protein
VRYECQVEECKAVLVVEDADEPILAAVRRGTFERMVADHQRMHGEMRPAGG